MPPYVRTNWADYPNLSTAINAARLNNMEAGIAAAIQPGNGQIVDADVALNAAIQYIKLNLANQILNGDISPAAAIAISKLAGYPGDATQLLHGDGSWSTPAAAAMHVLQRYSGNPLAVASATVAETDLFGAAGVGFVVPGGTLGTTGVIRVRITLDVLNSSGGSINSPTVKIYYGAGSATSTVPVVYATSGNRHTVRLDVDVIAMGATGSQMLSGAYLDQSGQVIYPGPATTGQAAGIVAVDSTVAQNLRVTVVNPSNNANYATRSFTAGIEVSA